MKTLLALIACAACGITLAAPVLKPIGDSLNKIARLPLR